MNHRRGFTLLELSVVLVIIGLLIGSIVVGRDLVEGFRLRAAIGQIEKYRTAIKTFQLKYNALPGDMTEALADDAGFTAPPVRRDTVYMVHGNGLIECGTNNFVGAAYFYGECMEVWEDLSSAGLIAGQFTRFAETPGSAGSLTPATLGGFVPASVLGNNNWVLAYGVYGGTNTSWMLPAVPTGSYFQLAGVASTSASGQVTTENDLTPTQAKNIDSKIDDGVFNAGNVRASNQPESVDVNGLAPVSTANTCAALKVWGAAADAYQTAAYPNTLACQLSFRW